MLIGVKPGNVFASLKKILPLCFSRRKSTRAIPFQVGRDLYPGRPVDILVLVGVELRGRHYLARNGRLRTLVTQDGALYLASIQTFLDNHPAVMPEGQLQRRDQLLFGIHPADTDGGSSV